MRSVRSFVFSSEFSLSIMGRKVCMFNKIVAHFLSLIFAQGNPADSVNAAINCGKHYQSPTYQPEEFWKVILGWHSAVF